MAALTHSELVTISINGVDLQVPKGELIVESVKRLGLEIPIFCYHPRMKPVGMCRMCLVEVGFKQPDGSVRKMPKPQAGCTLPASEGMVIFTDSEAVHKDRKGVLEFLLINHPLDCPICDRGGECPLQNNTIFYGPSTTRFTELKRHQAKAYPLSDYVTLDLERCIQCGRCVRFTEEISGDAELAFRFRGSQMQPSTFKLMNFESKFSGNVIEICPVGALTSSKYRFRARPWDLETKPFNCLECSNHCAVWFDYRSGKFVRLNGRTNEAVNEEWTCDKGKFGHDWYNSEDRLSRVLVRDGNAFVESDWSTAYQLIQPAFVGQGGDVAGIFTAPLSNEALFLAKDLFEGAFGSRNLDYRVTRHQQSADERLERKLGIAQVQDSIADLELKAGVIVFGTSLADELPMIHLRVRKGWSNREMPVAVLTSDTTDVDRFAKIVVRYKAGTEAVVAGGLLAAAIELGKANVPDPVKAMLPSYSQVEKATGVTESELKAVAGMMGENVALIASDLLFNSRDAQATLELLGGLAMTTGSSFNCYATSGNDAGAEALGVWPVAGGLNTQQILEACASGQLKSLFIVGDELWDRFHDRRLLIEAIETVDFLAYAGSMDSELASYASVVLPLAAPAEQEGSYVNCERRLQKTEAVLRAPGDAKAGWRIFAELAMRIKPGKPYFSSDEVLAAIAAAHPQFKGADSSADPEGFLLSGGVLSEVAHA